MKGLHRSPVIGANGARYRVTKARALLPLRPVGNRLRGVLTAGPTSASRCHPV